MENELQQGCAIKHSSAGGYYWRKETFFGPMTPEHPNGTKKYFPSREAAFADLKAQHLELEEKERKLRAIGIGVVTVAAIGTGGIAVPILAGGLWAARKLYLMLEKNDE